MKHCVYKWQYRKHLTFLPQAQSDAETDIKCNNFHCNMIISVEEKTSIQLGYLRLLYVCTCTYCRYLLAIERRSKEAGCCPSPMVALDKAHPLCLLQQNYQWDSVKKVPASQVVSTATAVSTSSLQPCTVAENSDSLQMATFDDNLNQSNAPGSSKKRGHPLKP